LLDRFGSAGRVLAADRASLLTVKGIDEEIADSILGETTLELAQEELLRMRAGGVRLLFESDDEYPELLRQIDVCPHFLSVRGELLPTDKEAVAIVGSRRCTPYGRRIAEKLAYELAARGITVVSGLAYGIDAVAHEAALRAGGRTIAVLASGLANIYPKPHRELADKVASNGAVVTEAPLDGPPIGALFPLRNRIISGLSLGVVVVEAAAKSGALSTAHHALHQNREVFAVPGPIGETASEGTNLLLKRGAQLVQSIDDVFEGLGRKTPPVRAVVAASSSDASSQGPSLSAVEQKLWNAIGAGEMELEKILEQTGLSAAEANSSLMMMELRRLVARRPGNRFARR
jgi:DNA processing protein